MWGYEQPTIASRARSPSPYTHRRMAELSINDPFETATATKPYKTEIDSKPEFVIRKVQLFLLLSSEINTIIIIVGFLRHYVTRESCVTVIDELRKEHVSIMIRVGARKENSEF